MPNIVKQRHTCIVFVADFGVAVCGPSALDDGVFDFDGPVGDGSSGDVVVVTPRVLPHAVDVPVQQDKQDYDDHGAEDDPHHDLLPILHNGLLTVLLHHLTVVFSHTTVINKCCAATHVCTTPPAGMLLPSCFYLEYTTYTHAQMPISNVAVNHKKITQLLNG